MNYKAIGRLLAAADKHVGCFSPRALSNAFVAVDVVCVILQFGGSVCAAISVALQERLVTEIANDLLVTSFVIQLVLNLAFTLLIWGMYHQTQFAPATATVPNIQRVSMKAIQIVAL
jgi:hypothetical protein